MNARDKALQRVGVFAVASVQRAVDEARTKNEPLTAEGPALDLLEVVLALAEVGVSVLQGPRG